MMNFTHTEKKKSTGDNENPSFTFRIEGQWVNGHEIFFENIRKNPWEGYN